MLMFAIGVMQVNGGEICMPAWQGGVSIRLIYIAKLIFWNVKLCNTIKTIEFQDQRKNTAMGEYRDSGIS